MAAVVLALHVVGFFLLFALIVPSHLSLGTAGLFRVGIGITAYTLGLRHAFDADHIGAIDNTTRKLMTDGQRPVSVGFFFSLGHSTIVFVLGAAVHDRDPRVERGGQRRQLVPAPGDRADRPDRLGHLPDDHRDPQPARPGQHRGRSSGGCAGPLRRGRAGGAARQPRVHEPLLQAGDERGHEAVADVPGRALFGLGFDTATEIALLATAGAAAAGGLPIYAILCLPILFAAGMSLLDTIDGAFMNFAYGWAFSKPVRKIFYNITITWLSVVVALRDRDDRAARRCSPRSSASTGQPWDFVSGLDLNYVGYAIVGAVRRSPGRSRWPSGTSVGSRSSWSAGMPSTEST